MKQVIVLGERPADVPANWTIYNAPRPIYGHREWQGDFACGIFYAAIDPNGEGAEWMHSENRLNKACVVKYVSKADVMTWVYAYGEKRGVSRERIDAVPFNALLGIYAQEHAEVDG